jgi:hypothetical protein
MPGHELVKKEIIAEVSSALGRFFGTTRGARLRCEVKVDLENSVIRLDGVDHHGLPMRVSIAFASA